MQINKKTLAALAVSSLLSGAAMAETSFTIYGRGNVSVENQKIGSESKTVFVDNSSRVGLRALKDIAGGMEAGFTLEANTNLSTGKVDSDVAGGSGTFFAREATMHLGGAFGQIKLGRLPVSAAYFATADYISNHNHDTGTSSDALWDTAAAGQMKQAIGYTSPSLSGVVLQAQYGLKNSTGSAANDVDSVKVAPVSFAATYGVGPLGLALAYERGDNTYSPQVGDTYNVTTARANYTIGAITLGAYAQRTSGVMADRNAYRLSAMYTLGQNEFHANYGAAGNRAGSANSGADQFTLGYNYNLDKQTKVYALYTQINNKSTATYNMTRSFTGVAAGQDASSYAVGVRYNF